MKKIRCPFQIRVTEREQQDFHWFGIEDEGGQNGKIFDEISCEMFTRVPKLFP